MKHLKKFDLPAEEEVQSAKWKQKLTSFLDYNGDLHDIDHLNSIFSPLSFLERIHLLYAYFRPEEVLLTSSFGANSAFLLAQVSKMRPTQAVHFIDTGFHFEETLAYRNTLADKLNIRVVNVLPDPTDHQKVEATQLWSSDPDACCDLNKVQPLNEVKKQFKVWISGLMGFQTPYRAGLQVFEKQGDLLKFHPLIDISEADFQAAFAEMDLPAHPLSACGYGSIGCTHCTKKGDGRSGRWAEEQKTECGLHPDFFSKKK
ncbi:MAG: phosphoadenylyl-sulfate reductase [Saprospiraceae bacterium]|nr:phosphoadenylyl-sulfate reductase [Saprospiraceae bacterium]